MNICFHGHFLELRAATQHQLLNTARN